MTKHQNKQVPQDILKREEATPPLAQDNHLTSAPGQLKPTASLTRRKYLPTDTYAFFKLRDPANNLLYIDKTALIYQLISRDRYYFLSRPRRFGKSLLISTLKELFLGNKALFEGLAIASTEYDFPVFPVIHLDVYSKRFQQRQEFEDHLVGMLKRLVERNNWDFELLSASARDCFNELIDKLSVQGPVVILIDEYDKPILDSVEKDTSEDLSTTKMIRNVLQEFYSVIKERDADLRFVMVTGVSKFAKVSLFSGLNNLNDISLDNNYATLLGITQSELETSLKSHLMDMAQELEMDAGELKKLLKHWYNGYRFSDSDQRVYNPVSLMRALNQRKFDHYWFATGTPSMLIQLLKQHQSFELERLTKQTFQSVAFDTFDIDNLDLPSLMMQTGYLTIAETEGKIEKKYRLDYPNYEVKRTLFTYFLEDFTHMTRGASATPLSDLANALRQLDEKALECVLTESFFARIPYELHMPLEKFYHAVFHMICVMLGFEIRAEESTNLGRIDNVMFTDTQVFIFEMKYNKPAAQAIEQIKEKQYYRGYLNQGRQVVLVGLSFFEDRRIEAALELYDETSTSPQ